MERIIRIGIPEGIWSTALAALAHKVFRLPSWQCELVPLDADQLQGALLRGEVGCLARPLHETPVNPPEGIAHAALIERMDAAYTLLIRPEIQTNALFRLPRGAVVQVAHPAIRAQLRDFRPDLRLIPADGDAEARVLPSAEAAQFHAGSGDLVRLALNPREICPLPGEGAIVLQICAGDLATRRLLQSVHRPELSALTNVERKLQRLMGGDPQLALGAFCERDAMGHYHLWASFSAGEGTPLKRLRLSSSTTFELASQAFAAFQ